MKSFSKSRRRFRRRFNYLTRRFVKRQLAPVYRLFFHRIFCAAAYEKIEEFRPDLVHCNDWPTLYTGHRLKEKLGCTLIFDSHELETHRNPPLSRLMKQHILRYERKLLPKCDKVFTVCDPIADVLATQNRIERPQVIYNAPRLNNDDVLEGSVWGRVSDSGQVRKDCGVKPGQFLFVTIGNVTVNRGLELVIKALGVLPDHIVFCALGKCSDLTKSSLMRLARENFVSDRVRFLDPVHPATIVSYIKSADAGIIPIIPETLSYEVCLPNKLFEMAFADLFIVSADLLELSRFVKTYDLGALFEAGNAHALAKVMLDVVNRSKQGPLTRDNSAFRETYDFTKQMSVFDFVTNRMAGPPAKN
jgi:glycogen synthase